MFEKNVTSLDIIVRAESVADASLFSADAEIGCPAEKEPWMASLLNPPMERIIKGRRC